jgi:hypothetical protein
LPREDRISEGMEDLNSRPELSRSSSVSLGREFFAEVNDLTDVMVGVSGAAQDDGEAILSPAVLCGVSGTRSFR